MRVTKIRLQFKLQDFWIGVYWKSSFKLTNIWICFIPCFPINIKLEWSWKVGYKGLSRADSIEQIKEELDFVKELRKKTAQLEKIAKESQDESHN